MPQEQTHPEVGRRLVAARLQRGLSQGTIARRARIAPSYLSRIETGKVHPTFRTVMRITRAIKADLEEIVGPTVASDRARGACPVTAKGRCLLDLVKSEPGSGDGGSGEFYTPREIRLLRRLASWMKTVTPDRLRAMEILLDDLTRTGG